MKLFTFADVVKMHMNVLLKSFIDCRRDCEG